jgi:hypothetical protein
MVQPVNIGALLGSIGQLQRSNAEERRRKDEAAARRRRGITSLVTTAGTIGGGLAFGPVGAAVGGAAGSALASQVGGQPLTGQAVAAQGLNVANQFALQGLQENKIESNRAFGRNALLDAAPATAQQIATVETDQQRVVVTSNPLVVPLQNLQTKIAALDPNSKNFEKNVTALRTSFDKRSRNIATKEFNTAALSSNKSGTDLLASLGPDLANSVSPEQVQKANLEFEKNNENIQQQKFNAAVFAAKTPEEIQAIISTANKRDVKPGNFNIALRRKNVLRKEIKAERVRLAGVARQRSATEFKVATTVSGRRDKIAKRLETEDDLGNKVKASPKVVDRGLRDELSGLVASTSGTERKTLEKEFKSIDTKIKRETTDELIAQLPALTPTVASIDEAIASIESGKGPVDVNNDEALFELRKRKKVLVAEAKTRRLEIEKEARINKQKLLKINKVNSRVAGTPRKRKPTLPLSALSPFG